MAETPDEVYDRVLAEEQAKGSTPAVAEGRAKAARHRAKKGIPTDPAGAAAAAGPREAGSAAPAAEAPAPEPEPAEAAPTPEPGPAEAAPQTAAAVATEAPAAAGVATATAPAEAPAQAKGRGAAARAKANGGNGAAAPDRIQRLLAVVKPEAIQRVEREPIDRVNTWPHLMAAEFVALLAVTAFLVLFSAFVDAPFRELANINQTPNPSKAPWYFLGLQELLRYFHPQIAGVTIPQWIILGLMAAPYIDRNPSNRPSDRKVAIVVFTIFILLNAVLTILGSLFRGPGFNFIYPWEAGLFFEL